MTFEREPDPRDAMTDVEVLLDRVRRETKHLIDPDGWEIDDDDLQYEQDEEPGWTISLDGGRVTMHWGCIDFEADVQYDDYGAAVTRLLRAAAAWNADVVAP